MVPPPATVRIGIDLGGTKIAGLVVTADGKTVAQERRPTPREDYGATLNAIADLIADLEAKAASTGTIGIGMPGSLSPATGRVQNANSTWLNGQALDRDLASRLGRPVRLANDANCFALSEAVDGAAQGAATVFGVILGTGCGGGIVRHGHLIDGPHGIAGEWGHTPLPRPRENEYPGPECWCGRRSCIETWVSGPGLEADHERETGDRLGAHEIAASASSGNAQARASLDRHADRLARGLAQVVNVLDPDVIVLGGGLSNMVHLYEQLPGLIAPHIFADHQKTDIRPPMHGDASGVRGAAWLWND